MKKVLIPIDGSEHSKKALLWVKDLCILRDCDLYLVTVVNTLRDCNHISNQEFKSQLCKNNIDKGERVLKEAISLLKDYTGTVNAKLICGGDVADEIINYAERGGFDLVVMSNRGLGSFSRTLLGSISNKVVNNINVSTLIVK